MSCWWYGQILFLRQLSLFRLELFQLVSSDLKISKCQKPKNSGGSITTQIVQANELNR